MTKPTKWFVRPAKTQISLGIRPIWSVFAVRTKKVWFLSYPLSAQRRLWSDWAGAQAYPSLRWAHSHFLGFIMRRLIFFCRNWRYEKFCHNQQFFSWIYLYAITAAAENTLIWMGNTFLICVFFESKTNRTSVQTDCTILVFPNRMHVFVLISDEF